MGKGDDPFLLKCGPFSGAFAFSFTEGYHLSSVLFLSAKLVGMKFCWVNFLLKGVEMSSDHFTHL